MDLPWEFGNTDHNPADVPFECNNKLLGAQQTLETYRALIGAEDFEFDSARDDDGHGTHTTSTAAANGGVEATIGQHDDDGSLVINSAPASATLGEVGTVAASWSGAGTEWVPGCRVAQRRRRNPRPDGHQS